MHNCFQGQEGYICLLRVLTSATSDGPVDASRQVFLRLGRCRAQSRYELPHLTMSCRLNCCCRWSQRSHQRKKMSYRCCCCQRCCWSLSCLMSWRPSCASCRLLWQLPPQRRPSWRRLAAALKPPGSEACTAHKQRFLIPCPTGGLQAMQCAHTVRQGCKHPYREPPKPSKVDIMLMIRAPADADAHN